MQRRFKMVSASVLPMSLHIGLPISLALVVTACGGGSTPTAPNTNIGQLTISFTAPSGVNTAATVTGPGGYSSTVTTNTTLGSLAPGSYTITPVSVRRVGPIVDEFYDGSVTGAATVSNNATATSSVTFAKRGGSGNLWLPGCEKGTARGGVNSYDPSTFDPSMTPSPAIILSNGTCAEGAAFDAAGNLWISDYNLKISMYTPAQLATNLSPSVVLTNPADPTTSFNKPTDLAFDKNGNLWVANYLDSKLVEFTPSQLAASGSPVPSVVLSGTNLYQPGGLAFDGGGNLWVGYTSTGPGKAGTVVKFLASSLANSGTLTPAADITDITIGNGPQLYVPYGLAFDSRGVLWVSGTSSFSFSNRVSKYDVSAMSGSVKATPVTTLKMAGGTTPVNIGFDNLGGRSLES